MAIKLSNNAVSRLAAELAQGDTQIILTPGDGSMFPTLAPGDFFPATLVKTSGQYEIVRATARDVDALTVTRAQESTQAMSFATGDRIELRITAGILMSIAEQSRPRVGDIKMWSGAIADIPSVHGPGWQLADGTNGTIDLRDRFIVGAGSSYAPGNTGGAASVTLTAAQMPAHNHGVTDPGHAHTVTDPGHAHSVYDPGHSHNTNSNNYNIGSSGSGTATPYNGSGSFVSGGAILTGYTGISIYSAATGISIASRTTGITTQNAGSGAAHENRPPYYALAFIEYTGIGAGL
ncbi:tail fiber protein [Ralstonia phage UAM5]|nr:tail fiber protein [Ralstonia phage UAM5]